MQRAPLVIGIAGGTGSGKTTLAASLVSELSGDVAVLEHDWYYRDRSGLSQSEREDINYDEPAALDNALLAQHLAELRAGRAVECPQYDFATHTRKSTTRTIAPARIVAVEGILLFAIPELCSAFDLRIFVDTDDDIRLMRRIARDIVERKHVAPSKRHAHLVVPEGGENAQALDVLVGRLKYLLLGH